MLDCGDFRVVPYRAVPSTSGGDGFGNPWYQLKPGLRPGKTKITSLRASPKVCGNPQPQEKPRANFVTKYAAIYWATFVRFS